MAEADGEEKPHVPTPTPHLPLTEGDGDPRGLARGARLDVTVVGSLLAINYACCWGENRGGGGVLAGGSDMSKLWKSQPVGVAGLRLSSRVSKFSGRVMES